MMKPIPGCAGYFATRNGTILSTRTGPALALTPGMKKGYAHVTVRIGVGRVTMRRRPVHQLVLEAFVGLKPFEGAVTRHLNGDRRDNRPENLRWGTAKENHADSVRHGTYAGLRHGDRHPRTRISEAAVQHIRGSSRPASELAASYGCTRQWVHRIRTGNARRVDAPIGRVKSLPLAA